MFKIFVAILILVPSISYGQTTVTTGPVTTSMRFAWTLPVNIPVSDHQTFEVRLRDSRSPAVITALTNVQCPTTSCTAQLIPANVDALNIIGLHAITLTYFRQDVGESPQSSPFQLTSPAVAPTNFRIIQ